MNLQNIQNTTESSFSTASNGAPNGDTGTNGSAGHHQEADRSAAGAASLSGALRNGLGLVAKKAGFKQFENEQ